MNKALLSLLLAMLLSGCAARDPASAEPSEPAAAPAAVQTEDTPVPEGFSINLISEEGSLRKYALSEPTMGFRPVENDLLFFGDTGKLTLLDFETGRQIADHEAPVLLSPQNATVQILDSGISYFNGAAGETVLLDKTLREIRRIAAPEGLTGMPLLSRDGRSVYYCTASAIRVLDVDSGISRVLKEAAYPVQSVSALLLNDAILQVSITEADGTWRTLFLSTENGQLKHSAEGNILPETSGTHYFLSSPSILLWGAADGSAMVLDARHTDTGCRYLPGSNRAVTSGLTESGSVLECYDLTAGSLRAELAFPCPLFPEHTAETADGAVWFLHSDENGQSLYRWDPEQSAVSDGNLYIHPYYTRNDPDYEGLAACALYAQEIGSKYGIEVLIYKDAAAMEPWDYRLEYEHQVSVLQRELEALDRHLARFPAPFLAELRSKFTALKICIIRSAAGTPESGSPVSVNGIQFLEDFDAYIVLCTEHNTEYALYHELSHLMETVVLTESTAYDRWNNLNPEGFSYDGDLQANALQDGSPWLRSGQEYFIDAYAMSYPKEDRARLFESAMTSGHEELFRSPHLQSKLKQMCTGIREAFDLEYWPEPLLWEQYLMQ